MYRRPTYFCSGMDLPLSNRNIGISECPAWDERKGDPPVIRTMTLRTLLPEY